MIEHDSTRAPVISSRALWRVVPLLALAACVMEVDLADDPSAPEPLAGFRAASGAVASDDFARADSLVLGSTAQGHAWSEAGGADEHARIIDGKLSVHYFDPVSIGTVHANVEDYQAGDIDLTVRMKGYSGYYMSEGRVFGPSWRMADQDGAWDSPGYHLEIDADGLAIRAGGVALGAECQAASPIDDDWHEYRVVSVGRRHQVYVDGAVAIDGCYDATYPGAGYVGLHAYYSIFEADDLWVQEFEPPARTYPQYAAYAPADAHASVSVADYFERTDASALGASAGGIQWIEAGDGDTHVTIEDGALRVHYFADQGPPLSQPVHPHSWAVIDALELRDVELRGRARGYSEYYMTDRPFGFSYRLQGAGVDHDDAGYHVLVSASGVELRAGDALVASWAGAVDTAWHDYRVEAIGDRHRVFMDGSPIIDAVDATYPDQGRIGIAGYYSLSFFDDLSVRSLPTFGAGEPVSDDFERSSADALGSAVGGGVSWLEEGGDDRHVRIEDGALHIHYFADQSPPESLPVHPHSWAVLDGLALQNVELRGRARGYSEYYMTDRPLGFSYRLQGAAVDYDDPGYHVLVSAAGVELRAGAVLVSSWAGTVDTAWHDYRVEAVGDQHRVYMDDALIIDATDATYPSEGRVGVAGNHTIAYFDDISARALPTSGVDPRTLDMTSFYWSVEPEDVDDARTDGINAAHAYVDAIEQETAASATVAVEDHVSRMAAEQMSVLASLGAHFVATEGDDPSTMADTADAIAALDTYGNVSFWYLPEELRYWESAERTQGENLRDWAQQYDPEQRPVLMYSPNNGTGKRFNEEFQWSHVVVGGAYATPGTSQSLAWARWRVQQMLVGLHGSVYMGSNHGQGGRTPMIAGWCHPSIPTFGKDEAYNFVFSTLAEGARGVGVWSYFHGSQWDPQALGPGCLEGYQDAFTALQDPAHPLGRALLHGSRDPSLGVVVTAGQAQTEAFTPVTDVVSLKLPSVAAALVLYEGQRYIIAANSRADAVTVEFSGAGRSGQVEVLQENRSIAMVDGTFSDAFGGQAVHLYAVPTGSP